MAFGSSTVSDFGGAVSDIFAAKGFAYKAKGAEYEKAGYTQAAQYADQNAVYQQWSTNIQKAQADRTLFKSLGETQADIAGAGFAASGSAIDILRESAGQGALTHAVLSEQGIIQEQGYKQQAQSYRTMAEASQVAIDAAKTAETGAYISGGIKAIAGFASLIPA